MKVRKKNGLTVKLLSTLLFAYSGCAGAVDTALSVVITLEDAIVQVLERSPQLQAAEYESRAAAARIRQAHLTTPWKVNIELENFAGNGLYSEFDAVEATLSIARVLELGEKPELRGELAQQEAVLLRNTQDARRLDLVAETARRFVDVVTRQEFLVITNESVTLARRTLEAVERRVQAGRTSLAEQRRAGIAVARAELEQEHASHQLDTARQKLASMWGETRANFSRTEARLFTLNPVVDFERLESLLVRNPDLVRYATEQRVGAARTALARSRQRPDLELAGGVRYLGLSDSAALVFSASIPLGTSKRAANLIEASEQASLVSPLMYEQRRLELHSTLFEIYQELQHVATAVEVFGQQIIPEAEHALDDYEKGFAAGRYSLLELADAQRVLLNARLEYLAAASDFHRSQIEIERLTGAALNTGATP